MDLLLEGRELGSAVVLEVLHHTRGSRDGAVTTTLRPPFCDRLPRWRPAIPVGSQFKIKYLSKFAFITRTKPTWEVLHHARGSRDGADAVTRSLRAPLRNRLPRWGPAGPVGSQSQMQDQPIKK